MFTKQVFAALVCALALTSGAVQGEITPFSDNFNDANSSVNYTVAMGTADNNVTFAYDYSALGIPVAPSTTDSSTLGLLLQSNLVALSEDELEDEAVTLHTLPTFDAGTDGDFTVSFDLWKNTNGPFPLGGSGAQQLFTAGVSGDGSTANRDTVSGSGVYVAGTGIGKSSRDYRLYKPNINSGAGGEQSLSTGQYACGTTSTCLNNTNAYYAGFGSIDVGPLQGPGTAADGSNQTGTTDPGTLAFEWHQVLLAVDADGSPYDDGPAVSWFVDGLLIGTLYSGVSSQASWEVNGTVTLGNLDPLADVADVVEFNFTLIDNLEISAGLPKSEAAIKGDMNNDGDVTEADVPLFIQALVDLAAYESAYPFIDGPATGDVNNDFVFDFGDIQAFQDLFDNATATSSAVPEPSSVILSLWAASVLITRRRKCRELASNAFLKRS